MRDYDHAGDHLNKARELANTRDPQRLKSMEDRLAKYKEAALERELLDQIQAARSRGTLLDFEKGGKLITKFETDFPPSKSKLKQEFDLEIATLPDQTAPGFQGMTWSATAVLDDTRPDIWLVRLKIRWLEEGEDVFEEFLRVLPRQLPLGQRVRRFREDHSAVR